MNDLSSLTKEQLLELLKQKEEVEKPSVETTTSPETLLGKPCCFRPNRANQKQCSDVAITDWGFCKKHSRTVQAKNARNIWEEKTKEEHPLVEEEKPVETPVKTPVASTSSTIEQELDKITKKLDNMSTTKKRPRRKKKTIKIKVIMPNHYGLFEDTDTHIVFHPTTKEAYGVQLPNGGLGALTPNHVAICEKQGWSYIIPSEESEEESEEEYESEESSEEYESSEYETEEEDYSDEEYSSE